VSKHARPLCPAAIIVHPVLSPNRDDAECQIAGRLQPAEQSPCCNEYTRCGIWRTIKDAETASQDTKMRETIRAGRQHQHVLPGNVQRDRILV
jgi:hypothetical protein